MSVQHGGQYAAGLHGQCAAGLRGIAFSMWNTKNAISP
jgi:hypothetical protein